MIPFVDFKKTNSHLKSELNDAICKVVDSGWYILGNECLSFESSFSKYCGAGFTIGTANGLDALTLIFRAYKELGIMKEGDEIIVPDATWIASAAPIIYLGAKPVFADIDPETWCISNKTVKHLINKNTKAVFLTHAQGFNGLST